MNYPQTLAKAKTLLEPQHYAQAVQATTGAFESLLVALYDRGAAQRSAKATILSTISQMDKDHIGAIP